MACWVAVKLEGRPAMSPCTLSSFGALSTRLMVSGPEPQIPVAPFSLTVTSSVRPLTVPRIALPPSKRPTLICGPWAPSGVMSAVVWKPAPTMVKRWSGPPAWTFAALPASVVAQPAQRKSSPTANAPGTRIDSLDSTPLSDMAHLLGNPPLRNGSYPIRGPLELVADGKAQVDDGEPHLHRQRIHVEAPDHQGGVSTSPLIAEADRAGEAREAGEGDAPP